MRSPIPRSLRPAIAACACLAAVSAVALGVLPQQQGTVDLLNQANVTIKGAAAGDVSGSSVAAAGDVNGDGVDDVIVGAPLADVGGHPNAGSSYVIYGSTSQADADLAALGSRGFRIVGVGGSDWSGASVAGAGDVNGDGLDDVVVGAPYANPSSKTDAGTTYVIYGQATASDVDLAALGARGFRIDGAHAHDASGWSVDGAGDINGDGLADIVVGAPDADPLPLSVPSAGVTYVVYGRVPTSNVDLSSLGSRGFRITGAESGGHSGYSVAGAGDVNGDGIPDVIVGARSADPRSRGTDAGASYVIYGQASPSDVDLGALAPGGFGPGGFRIDGAAAGDRSGSSVDGAGDINGDGFADVIIGAPEADTAAGTDAGAADVVFGNAQPALIDTAGLGLAGFHIAGGHSWAYSGTSVAGAGDVNGDGLADVIVGTPDADAPGAVTAGVSDVVFGCACRANVDLAALGSRGIVINGARANGSSGNAVAGSGDVNGDGRPDVIVGAQYADTALGSDAGESYIVDGFGTASVSYPGLIAGSAGAPIADRAPQVARTGSATFVVSPPLPVGLTLNTATGVISGTPTEVASGTYTVTMTDLSGTASTTVTVAVTSNAEPTAPPVASGTASPAAPMVPAKSRAPQRAGSVALTRAQARAGIDVTSMGTAIIALACPADGATCHMTGQLTASALTIRRRIETAAAPVVLARVPSIAVESGGTKVVTLRLRPAQFARLRAAGVTRLPALLAVRTASVMTGPPTRTRVTLRIPAPLRPAVVG